MLHEWITESNSRVYFDESHNETFVKATPYPKFEEYQAIWGGDLRVLQAARVSNKGQNDGTTEWFKDRKLLRYLWENQHVSPFEHIHLTFTVVTDLRTAMQMDTHRTWHRNRYSRRYAADWVEFVKPVWRIQNTTGNKQAGDAPADAPFQAQATEDFELHCQSAVDLYTKWIDNEMAREQAAWFLPTGVMTSTFYTVDLRNLIGFLKVRAEKHAQKEVQDIAYIIKDKMIPLVAPWTAELINDLNEEWAKQNDAPPYSEP